MLSRPELPAESQDISVRLTPRSAVALDRSMRLTGVGKQVTMNRAVQFYYLALSTTRPLPWWRRLLRRRPGAVIIERNGQQYRVVF